MPSADMTEIPNLPTTPTEGFGGFIRPTPLERAMGRLMRAPDHDAGGDGDGGADGGDGGAGAEGGSDAEGQSGADDAGDADGSLLGDAGAGAGEGADGEGKGEAAKADADDQKPDGPPEAYELKVTAKGEDGSDVEIELDPVLMEAATPVMKEIGLTNEQANKLAPLAVKVQEQMLKAQADNFAAMKSDWAKEAKADPEIGGKNWTETESFAAKALDTFGAASAKDAEGNETNEFRLLLNESGLGNHPVMLKMFRRIGEKLGEDSTFARSEAAPSKKSREEILYPDDVPKK